MVIVRALTEADLPQAQRIVLTAFGTFLGAPDLESFWFPPYAYARFGAEHIAAFAAEQDGELAGSNFATNWGSVGFFGPLTIHPELWDGGIGQRLVAAACEAFEGWSIRHAGLFTFAQSAKHIGLYGKFGFYPRFLTAIMAAPTRPSAVTPNWLRHLELSADQRLEAEAATRELTEAI
jgi:GNAT superfamily N-acetyltransferase